MESSIKFEPADKVFFPNKEYSAATLEIRNDWSSSVIFKMKSTRPGILKMRPVYGLVHPGKSITVNLAIRSPDPSELHFTRNDRFTVVVAPLPKGAAIPALVFRENKAVEVRQRAFRKTLRIALPAKPAPKKASAEKIVIVEKVVEKAPEKRSAEKTSAEKTSAEKVVVEKVYVEKVEKKEVIIKEEKKPEPKKEEDSESSSSGYGCITCSCLSDCGKSHNDKDYVRKKPKTKKLELADHTKTTTTEQSTTSASS